MTTDEDYRTGAEETLKALGLERDNTFYLEPDSKITRCEDDPKTGTYGAWVSVDIWVEGTPPDTIAEAS